MYDHNQTPFLSYSNFTIIAAISRLKVRILHSRIDDRWTLFVLLFRWICGGGLLMCQSATWFLLSLFALSLPINKKINLTIKALLKPSNKMLYLHTLWPIICAAASQSAQLHVRVFILFPEFVWHQADVSFLMSHQTAMTAGYVKKSVDAFDTVESCKNNAIGVAIIKPVVHKDSANHFLWVTLFFSQTKTKHNASECSTSL